MTTSGRSAIGLIAQPLTLPCGLTLPNRLVKCPMQETLAVGPYYDPPITYFSKLYDTWGRSQYGLIITGQVQVDIRFLSITGDVVVHDESMEPEHFEKWKEWAAVSKRHGTPSIVQLAHPGRRSPAGAGNRPSDMQTLCPSSVALKMGTSWLDKLLTDKVLETPKEMTLEDIDHVVSLFVHAARVAVAAGFDGVQIHAAHGFLVSQFLSPHTNRRTDEYGGTPYNRMEILRRLVRELRETCPPPLCVGVKLNSADYMAVGGLQQDEALEQVKWLVECGMVDFVEISGGNAEAATDKLRKSFGARSLEKAPVRSSTRIREGFYTEFAEKVQALHSAVPIQLSGGFRSRTGMGDALESGICDMIGLGRATVLQPDLPSAVILNPEVPDPEAIGVSHVVRGQWLSRILPVKVLGGGFTLQFFYHNMRRMGRGLSVDHKISLPMILIVDAIETIRSGISVLLQRILASR